MSALGLIKLFREMAARTLIFQQLVITSPVNKMKCPLSSTLPFMHIDKSSGTGSFLRFGNCRKEGILTLSYRT